MGRILRQSPSYVAAVLASTLFFHWSTSTLTNLYWRDWYHKSFMWLFLEFWRLIGVDVFRNISMVGDVSAKAIRFLAPLLGTLIFLAIARTATWKRVLVAALAAALCSLAYPVIGVVALPFYIADYRVLGEFTIIIGSLALCVLVTASRRFGKKQTPLIIEAEGPTSNEVAMADTNRS